MARPSELHFRAADTWLCGNFSISVQKKNLSVQKICCTTVTERTLAKVLSLSTWGNSYPRTKRELSRCTIILKIPPFSYALKLLSKDKTRTALHYFENSAIFLCVAMVSSCRPQYFWRALVTCAHVFQPCQCCTGWVSSLCMPHETSRVICTNRSIRAYIQLHRHTKP